MISLFRPSLAPEPEKKLVAKAWLIDPRNQSITQISNPHFPSLVSQFVGEDAECYKLDSKQTVVWMSDTDIYKRYAFYFEGMDYPYDVRRYSRALIVSLGPIYWSRDTILEWLRWYDKQNRYGDV